MAIDVKEGTWAKGSAEVLTFAIGVAISAMAIIAVILMLFSQRAKVNGPLFLCGWALALAAVSTVVYYLVGGEHAKTELDTLKSWLAVHNAAVMVVLFVVFGVDLIAKGLPPLTT